MTHDLVVPFLFGACAAFTLTLVALCWALAEIVVEVKVKEPPP